MAPLWKPSRIEPTRSAGSLSPNKRMMRSQIGRRLAALSPRSKLAIMVTADAIFLPLCVVGAVALRMGSLQVALQTSLAIQLMLGLLALPVLGAAGLYRTVVRYIDLRVFVASSGALAARRRRAVGDRGRSRRCVVLPRSALPIFWFVAFAYVVTSRFIARSLLRRGMKQSAGTGCARPSTAPAMPAPSSPRRCS